MRLIIAAATIVISALLLFVRLGHYALWDDEANTALIGEGVWHHGDTSALVGRNIVAYRNGGELEGTRERYLPPLQYYVAAPFVGPFAPNAFLARMPFAFVGLLIVPLMFWWMHKQNRPAVEWIILGIGIIGNVSLILYCRQCRYYALAIAATVLSVYVYFHWSGRWRDVVLMAMALLSLLACNYLNFLALVICLALDYAIWGRKQIRVTWPRAMALAAPLVLIGGAIVLTWNPLGKSVAAVERKPWPIEHLLLFWWNLRDLNRNEFGSGLLLLAAPVIPLIFARSQILWRASLAALVYIAVIAATSPQSTQVTNVADVRYLAPLIPLLIAMGVIVIAAVSGKNLWLAAPLAVICLATNITNGGIHVGPNPIEDAGQIAGFSSSVTRLIGEYISGPRDPYTETARWINQNATAGQSVLVVPDYARYPLMFHAPNVVYAWQLSWPPRPGFETLPAIDFEGREVPDYLVAFGPMIGAIDSRFFPPKTQYTPVHQIDIFWHDFYRPELMWRRFAELSDFDRNGNTVLIFARQQ